MKKVIKYIVPIVVAGLLLYNSVYFKKLDAKKAAIENELSPNAFAQKFWAEKFVPYMDSAVEISSFLKMAKENPEEVFRRYSKTQGIGNASFFLVKGEGIIKAVNEDEVLVAVRSGTGEIKVKLNTGIYFGNAVRDVTGKISMGDFSNTMDFNSVSTELNKIVHMQVITPLKAKATKGAMVQFIGCIEIGQEQMIPEYANILPVKINIIQ